MIVYPGLPTVTAGDTLIGRLVNNERMYYYGRKNSYLQWNDHVILRISRTRKSRKRKLIVN